MIQHVLCPTDGSPHALKAVAAAADLARKYRARLTICLINIPVGGDMGPVLYLWPLEDVKEVLAEARETALSRGAEMIQTEEISGGDAATGIIDYARSHRIDHIVIGTGDKRGLSRLVLGSVAADVAARAPCSVTIAR